VESNKRAFSFGRLAAHDPQRVEAMARPVLRAPGQAPADDLAGLVARRAEFLTGYQDDAYAARYRAMVARVAEAEQTRAKGRAGLAEAVARNYFKLLAYKDEYEVARLHADPAFRAKLDRQFAGGFKLSFHLAPPLLARRDPATGQLQKREFGAWLLPILRLLAKLKGLRGTAFDPFGRTAERRQERRLIADYERLLERLLQRLDSENHGLCLALAELPDRIRGFGHVKEANVKAAKAEETRLLAALDAPRSRARAAQ